MADLSYNEAMEAFSLDAVDYALTQYGLTLDFTQESLTHVEAIATALHKEMPKGFLGKLLKRGPSEQDLDLMSKMLGGYVGEVIRRQRGGDWAISEQFNTLGLKFSDDEWVFPLAKAYKRLTNGSEDDLAFFYKVIINDFLKANRTKEPLT
jgi:hypothetical protein